MSRRAPRTLLALLLLAACQQAASPAPAPEYRPEEAGTIDHALCLLGFDAVALREVSSGHHLVEATINGRSGSFVLDTGANLTVLDRRHVGHFGLENRGGLSGVVGGLGGGQRATQVSIDSLRVGEIDVRQERIVTADLGQLLQVLGQVTGTTVYGLVGQDVLKEHRAIVDVAGPRLYLMAEDRDPAPVPAEACSGDSATQEGAGEPANGG
jgi:clan AA aspartic protease (TIGR02281 family)